MNDLQNKTLHDSRSNKTDPTIVLSPFPSTKVKAPAIAVQNEFRRLAIRYQQCEWPDNTSSESSEYESLDVSSWSKKAGVLL